MGSWDDTFKKVITYAKIISEDDDGKPNYGLQSKIKCRIEKGKKRMVFGVAGTTVDVFDLIIASVPIVVESGIWLPGADVTKDEEARKPRVVSETDDLMGEDTLWEVEL